MNNVAQKVDLLNTERDRLIDTFQLQIDKDHPGLMHDLSTMGIASDTLVYAVSYAIDTATEGPGVVKTRMLNAFKDLKHLMDMNIQKLSPVLKGYTFGEVSDAIRDKPDWAMRLPHWATDVTIKIQKPDSHSKMTHPYYYVTSIRGMVPWNPTQVELLSTEWEIV
jgi:hypothetical protein